MYNLLLSTSNIGILVTDTDDQELEQVYVSIEKSLGDSHSNSNKTWLQLLLPFNENMGLVYSNRFLGTKEEGSQVLDPCFLQIQTLMDR